MTEISIKTGTVKDAESDCGAELEICDDKGKCCKTSFLDNKPGDDRESGQTNVYTKETILGLCAREVGKSILFNNHFHSQIQGSITSDLKTATVTITGDKKEDGSFSLHVYPIRESITNLVLLKVGTWSGSRSY